jgi:hypothetical protein
MSLITLTFRMLPDHAPNAMESYLTFGTDGVEARFRAVGAGDELYDQAIARDAPPYEGIGPPVYGVTRGDQFEIGWNDAAGELSMLVAYGIHLIQVRAYHRGLVEDLTHVFGSGRFAEVRGQLAERDDDGLRLQPIRSTDPHRLSLFDMTEAERATWDMLGTRCACPACSTRFWTAEESDAFAIELEADPEQVARRFPAFMVRTPALIRAAMLAGMHPQSPGWRRKRVWGPRSVQDAALVGKELLTHRRKLVREVAALAIAEAEKPFTRLW